MTPAEQKKPAPPDDASLVRMLFPRRPLQWVGVGLALGAVAGLGGGVVAATGLINLSAVPPHPDVLSHMLHFGMSRSVAHHAKQPPPEEPLSSPTLIELGAAQYSVVCEHCHGAPGFGQSPIALSLRPEPPMIVDASSRLSDKELFFIVQNGVRYTGMPAWPVLNRPDEIWSMVAFLKAAPKLDRQTYTRLARGNPDDVPRSIASAAERQPVADRWTTLAPFSPGDSPRPYLPGDPQTSFPSAAATLYPRIGFGIAAVAGDLMSACVACHAADGTGRPGGPFPNLTLQSPQYLYDALKAYATGNRQSGVMWPIAANLSDEQMRTLAIQLGSAAPIASRTHEATDSEKAAERAQGEKIMALGVGSAAVDAVPGGQSGTSAATPNIQRCSSCHIPGNYISKLVPRLEGQHAAYLRMQLRAFRAGGRGDSGPYNPMVANGHNLSERDIVSVSEFYASRPPLPKTGP